MGQSPRERLDFRWSHPAKPDRCQRSAEFIPPVRGEARPARGFRGKPLIFAEALSSNSIFGSLAFHKTRSPTNLRAFRRNKFRGSFGIDPINNG